MPLRRFAIALTALALLLRLYDLGSESIWLDEGASIRSGSLPVSTILTQPGSAAHPPLYRLVLHGWMSLSGRSENAVRLPSALLGALAVPLLLYTGRLLLGPGAAILAASLLCVSPLHVRYSQEATSYALFVLLSLLSMLFYVRWTRERWPLDTVGQAAASTLLLYAHAAGFFVVLAQWLHAFAAPAGERPWDHARGRVWLGLQAVALALYVPWLEVIGSQARQFHGAFWVPRPTPSTLAGTLLDFVGDVPAAACALALAALWLFSLRRRERTDEPGEPMSHPSPRAGSLLVLWFAVPLLLPYLLSLVWTPVFLTRTTLPASLALYLLAGLALTRIGSLPRLALFAALVVLSLLNLVGYYSRTNNERWREAVAYIERNAAPGDLVLVHSGFCKPNVYDYYARRGDLVVEPFPPNALQVDEAQMRALEPELAGRERVWLVISHSTDGRELLRHDLARRFRRMGSRLYPQAPYRFHRGPSYVGIALYRYEEPERTRNRGSRP